MPRVRLLQTSDVHLRRDRPERERALALAFDLARTRSADAILIAGDLFDRGQDAVGQRAVVRQLVESVAPRPVVFVPGNHDESCYGQDADYGANAIVLAERPWSRATVCGLEIVGIPYQHGKTAAECLTGLACEPRHTVLVSHGTIMDPVAASFAGDGEDGAYMPIFLSDLLKRSCYAALGHLHSGRNLIHRDGERLVAYAGSPVVTSRREVGHRGVLVVDFETGAGVLAHEFVPLATPYHEKVEARCSPGAELEAIERLAREAVARKKPGARVLARLEGVSLVPEKELRETAERTLSRAFAGAGPLPVSEATHPDDPEASYPILELATSSYASLAETAVVTEFVERLEACARAEGIDDPAVLQTALRLGLEAFLEALP
jgi:DNA repair exonuclease SbcCD nuclease subunit